LLAVLAVTSIVEVNRAAASFARGRLLSYAIGQWPGYQVAPHHELIASKLEAVERGDIRRLVITCPPRHGKSKLGSGFFPAWCQGRNPTWQIIAASYGQQLASEFGREVRDHSSSPLHAAAFPGSQLREDSQAAH